jgi:Cytochrome c7 and related cytochrome c
VNSRKGSLAVIVFAAALVVLLCVPHSRAAQQVPAQQVPDNLAPHPAPEQPIPYSHKLHVGTLHLQCQTCHTNPGNGVLMTIPTASTCMTCHKSVATDKPAIRKLASYAQSGMPIPWVRVYKVTPGVTWTHRKHLQAGIACQACHGDVGQMAAMSEATSVTSMGVCITCHEMHQAPTVCSTCHVWPRPQQYQ